MLELRLAQVRPESELATAEAVDRQRTAIGVAQQDVLARLAGHAVGLVRSYTVVPWLAVEIDAAGLAALEGMGDLIGRVLPDNVRAPSRPGGS